jgi:hypothetical protein
MNLYELKNKIDTILEEFEKREVRFVDVPVVMQVNDDLFDMSTDMIKITNTDDESIVVSIDSSDVFDDSEEDNEENKDLDSFENQDVNDERDDSLYF